MIFLFMYVHVRSITIYESILNPEKETIVWCVIQWENVNVFIPSHCSTGVQTYFPSKTLHSFFFFLQCYQAMHMYFVICSF